MAAGIVFCSLFKLSAQEDNSAAMKRIRMKDEAEMKSIKATLSFLKTSPSGLMYSQMAYQKGKNAKPAKFTKVTIRYALRTIDNQKEVKAYNKIPEEIALDKLPYGIQEAIKMMNLGAQCTVYMPASLSKSKYGDIGKGRAVGGLIELISVAP